MKSHFFAGRPAALAISIIAAVSLAACGSDSANKPATPSTDAHMTESTTAMTDSTGAMTDSTGAMTDSTGAMTDSTGP